MDSEAFERRYFLLENTKHLGVVKNCIHFKAFDALMKEYVYIKVKTTVSDTQYRDQNWPELFKLRHENLVTLLQYFDLRPPVNSGHTEVLPVIVMGYVQGQPLSTLSYPLPISTIRLIHEQLHAALNYLHSHKWIHGDIKPENVLIQQSADGPKVILCDIDQAGQLGIIPESLVGTPEYMAPGAALRHAYKPVHDFWSLGCMLYQLITGELPFGKRDFSREPLEAIQQIQETIRKTDISELMAPIPHDFRVSLTCYLSVNEQ